MVKKNKAVHRVGQYLDKDASHWFLICEDCGVEVKATYCVVGYEMSEHLGKIGKSIKTVCLKCSKDYRTLEALEW